MAPTSSYFALIGPFNVSTIPQRVFPVLHMVERTIECRVLRMMSEQFLRYYRTPGLSSGAHEVIFEKVRTALSRLEIINLVTEFCFNIGIQNGRRLTDEETKTLLWLLSNSFEEKNVSKTSFLSDVEPDEGIISKLIEIGPRLNFSTAWSTNAVSICASIGLKKIERIECSIRYLIHTKSKDEADSKPITPKEEHELVRKLHDRMTQCRYLKPLTSFDISGSAEDWYEVDVIGNGRAALEKANKDLGLAFDNWDLDYYTKLFQERVGRNPTSVECFDLAQSNSEHSRHWFFKGRLVVDGVEIDDSLFGMVMKTQLMSNDNNVIKFCDNSR